MESTYTAKSIWNADEAVLKMLMSLKAQAIQQFQTWDLKNLYWTLRNMWHEIDAKLTKKEQKGMSTWMNKLEKKWKEFSGSPENDPVALGKFYQSLEKVYIKLNRLMKKHGIYYREGQDPRTAVMDVDA